MPADPARLPLLVTRAEALAAGLTRDEIRQRVRSGRWQRLDTGVYLRSRAPAAVSDPHARERLAHVERCMASVRRHAGCTIGYASAALAYGLPLASGIPDLGQIIVPPGGWTGIRKGIRYREARLSDPDVRGVGIPVTSLARTWVDVARTLGLADALTTGDAACRLGALDADLAREVLDRLGRVRGVRQARSALAHLDGRRETALESLSMARLLDWHLPLPEPQREFGDEQGFVARVDFWWADARVVGEADGRLKYRTAEDLYAEKRREDRLRAMGLSVVRWGWSDLWGRPAMELRRRLTRVLSDDSYAPRQFSGPW